MYSAKNSLKVWVSNAAAPTAGGAANTLAQLPAGEIGFYDASTNLLLYNGTGTGYYAFRKPDGQILKSRTLVQSGTYINANPFLKTYVAPTMQKQTITVPAISASTFYQIRVEMKLVGMLGEYFKHGNYQTAASGDTLANTCQKLAESLIANLAREQKPYFTITYTGTTVVIEQKLLPYVRGKKRGRPVAFRAMLSAPEANATLSTLTTAGSDGIGYGPYIAEQEFFAQGDSDGLRFAGYPNSFDDRALFALATGKYNVIALTDENIQKTANADVRATEQYLLAWNDVGVTPSALITPASVVAGTVTVTGFAQPGASVQLLKNGSAEGAAVTADGTTGAWSRTGAVLASTNVVTATTILANATVGGSNSVTVA